MCIPTILPVRWRSALVAVALAYVATPAATAQGHAFALSPGGSGFQAGPTLGQSLKTHSQVYPYHDVDVMTCTSWGEWIIIASAQTHGFDHNPARIYHSPKFPKNALGLIQKLCTAGHPIDVLEFGLNGSFVLISGDDVFTSGSIPGGSQFLNDLNALIAEGAEITQVAFVPDLEGYVVLGELPFGPQIWSGAGLPQDLAQTLEDQRTADRRVRQIEIAPDYSWCLVAEDWFATQGVQEGLRKDLGSMQRGGRELDLVMLAPTGGWAAYSNRMEVPDTTELMQALEHNLGKWRTDSIFTRMDTLGVPGVAIAVIEEGQVRWVRGYGELEAGTQRPVLGSTPFDTASVAKGVAAFGIMSVVESETDFDLDTTLAEAVAVPASPGTLTVWSKCLPKFRTFNDDLPMDDITLRGLLSHTAAMVPHGSKSYTLEDCPNGWHFDYPDPGNGTSTLWTLMGMEVDAVTGMLSFGSGFSVWYDSNLDDTWDYSGGGLQLAAAVAEAYAGVPSFSRIAVPNIFEPIGMVDSTVVQPLPDQFRQRAAVPHEGMTPLPPGQQPFFPWAAAGGLYSSSADLARFVLTLVNRGVGPDGNRILETATVDAMLSNQIPDNFTVPSTIIPNPVTYPSHSTGYGLGLYVADWSAGGSDGWFHHAGDHGTGRAFVQGSPSTGQGLVILINSGDSKAVDLRTEIYAAYQRFCGWGKTRR